MSRYRSSTARDLVRAVEKAGGTVERVGSGRLKITGPNGTVTLQEPGEETRRDLRRSSAGKLVEERTGLILAETNPKPLQQGNTCWNCGEPSHGPAWVRCPLAEPHR